MDPTTIPALKQATELIRAGKKIQARVLLAKFVQSFPDNEHAWHIMSYALEDKGQQVYVLERALQINPQNVHVKTRLDKFAPPPVKLPEPVPPPVPAQEPAKQPEQSAFSTQASPTGNLLQTAGVSTSQSENLLQTTQASTSGGLLQSVAANIGEDTSPLKPPARKSSLLAKPETIAQSYEFLTPANRFGFWQQIKIRSIISWRRTKMNWRIFAQSPLAIMGLILIVLFSLMAIAHPILMKTVWPRGIYDPATGFDLMVFPNPSPPIPGHILGTDSLGRDVLSMILAATTPTFTVGITAALSTAFVGTLLSVTAAYFQGKVDLIITNMADVFLLFPAPIIMVIIGARFRDLGPVQLGLFYGVVTGAGATTIVMRAQAIQVAAKPFMEAAHIA
nr:ABC transporter permease subunit [Chloroflexota bacterium]